MTVQFHLHCVPPTTSHHAKRIVRVRKFARLADKPELVAAKSMLDELLIPHQIAAPVSGPVSLAVIFTWPWRAGARKRDRALGCMPHTSRPDLSNLVKTLEDRLVALRFLEDDNAVVELHVAKFWGDSPGIAVQIDQVEP